MKLFLSSILSLFMVGIASVSHGQHNVCGTDQYLAEILKSDPAMLKALTDYNEEISKVGNNDTKLYKGTTRTIPVVFHVIHTYGSENISKAQIEDQVRILNEAFQRLNADTAATRAIFKGVASDMDIEFKLARKDPNGNCTEGITRTYSAYTDGGDDYVKPLVRWDYRKYLNIWVVKNIAKEAGSSGGRVLGYATLPFWSNSTSDGIVVLSDYIGSVGTASSSGNKGRVLVHEIGHWLGLYHPFQGGCGGNCSNSGDYVCDTPPAAEPNFGCPTTNNTCNNDFPDQVDMVENFMDYANGTCQNMFTKGQKAVVDNVLTNSNYRALNISSQAHTATGIFTNPSCTAIADFNTENNIVTVCQGGSVNFKDYSYNGAITSYAWTFEGGSPATSSVAAPTINYLAAGSYSVTLVVTNAQGSNTKVKTKMITVVPTVSSIVTPVSEGFESAAVLNGNWIAWETGEYGWKRTTNYKYEGLAGLVAVIDEGSATNTVYTLVSSAYDLSVLKNRLPKLRFKVAYRPAVTGSTEVLTVWVTENCGQSWKPLKSYTNSTGLGVDKIVDPGFVPTSPSDWAELVLDLKSYENTKNLMVKFEARSRSGNSIFLDNVSIKPDLVSTGNLLNPNNLNVKVYPNPSKGSVNIDIETDGRSFDGIRIFNSTGQLVSDIESNLESKGTEVNFSVSHIQPGIYFAQINMEGQLIVKKFIVIP